MLAFFLVAVGGGGARRTQKQIVGVGTPASYFEYLYQVKELAVYVADDGDGGEDVDDVALAHKQFLCLGADGLDDGLGEELLLVQARYALVEIDRGGQAGHLGLLFFFSLFLFYGGVVR